MRILYSPRLFYSRKEQTLMKTTVELIELFLEANRIFITKNIDLFRTGVSERALCGALMGTIQRLILSEERMTAYEGCHVDVEYNRNDRKVKTIIDGNDRIISVCCDLIVHSRGHNRWQDNLIAIEMKKSNRPKTEKIADKERLVALTKDSDGVWSADGITLPENVCGYALGIFYEINLRKCKIYLEFYSLGTKISEIEMALTD